MSERAVGSGVGLVGSVPVARGSNSDLKETPTPIVRRWLVGFATTHW